MKRSMRLGSTEYPLHILIQGSSEDPNLFSAEEDYRHYRNLLVEICTERDCAIHAYVLMENHVRMLLTPRFDFGAGWFVEDLSQRYKTYLKENPRRDDRLFGCSNRVASLESGSQLFNCCRYIEQNPVRAGLAVHASQYRWSSFLHNAMGYEDPVVRPHQLYMRLGAAGSERQQKYRTMFRRPLNQDRLNEIRLWLTSEQSPRPRGFGST